jgi:uncharacterized protein (TIGR03437 family)
MSHTTTLLPDGTVLAAGGYILGPSATSSAELYRPAALTPAPRLFPGAIWHATTGMPISPEVPAGAGEILSMYTTSLIDGSVIPPRVIVGGRLAQVLYFGPAPGYPGYDQVNFVQPQGAASGSAVPVRLTYLDRSSNEVAISVK